MRQTLTAQVLEKVGAEGFYSRYTKLSEVSDRGESKGLCPLHEEKTPSFFVHLKKGSFFCFGCGKGGGPVQFYAFYHGLSIQQAKRRLAEEFQLDTPGHSRRRPGRRSKAAGRKSPSEENVSKPEESESGSFETKERATNTEIYSALLDAGRPLPDEVTAYFASRKIERETLARFHISYLKNPRQVARRLQDRFDLNSLVRSGVFRSTEQGSALFQFLNHPLLFPVFRNEMPVFVQGRLFGGGAGRFSKYCNLASVPVPCLVNVDAVGRLPAGSSVFLCEGAPDAMVLEQAGFHAVAVMGSSGFQAEWVSELASFKVHLVLDNDDAGRSGSQKIIRAFHANNLPVSVVELPDGVKDVNEFFLKYGAREFDELMGRASAQVVDLCASVRAMLARVADRSDSFSYPELAQEIYSWFELHGGVFVVNQEEQAFLMFEQVVYEIGNNDPFNALMFEKTELVPVQYQGRMVWQMLRSLCFLRGRRETKLGWFHTDESEGRIYVNLHGDANKILCLKAKDVEILANGGNEEGVMLGVADKMSAIEFDPAADVREAVQLLESLVMEPLACEPENKLFICCWILTAFFLDYTTDKGLLKLSGQTGSGKTTAARILSCLLYGADYVESATVAYYYADAARNPYLICDNLETENMNRDVIQFLLHVATGIRKGKRKAGTDSETVRESANALVAITAIEPLTKPELINRTYDVEFRSIFKRPGFMQREHLEQLTRARSRILSGLFLLFAREVMPGLQSEREEMLRRIQVVYPQHAKQRVDSFLTLMVVILRALLKMLEPGQDRTWELVDWWIRYQGRLAEETERDTNVAVYLLDALAKEMLAQESDFRKQYYLDFDKVRNGSEAPEEIRFVASSRDLLMALQILSKNKGFKLPFSNTQQLGVRLANESSVLEKAGWSWEREKVVRGLRYNRFTKRLG